MTSDPKAAAEFYRSVIGWEAKDSGMPGMSYTILSAGPTMVAGLMAIPDEAKAMGAPPSWIGYVAVADVDAAAAKAVAAGGKIYRAAADIPTVGRFAVMGDPQGAAFILFRPTGEPQGAPPPESTPGVFGWRELYAGELASAWSFYSSLFGWTKGDAMDMGPMGVYQLFNIQGAMAGGMMTKPAQAPAPYWNYYINVEAIDAAAARVKAGGGAVFMGPQEVPGGQWVVQARDPQGAFFSLIAPKR